MGDTWWSRRFLEVLETFRMGPKLQKGRGLARRGMVMDLNVEPGLVTAWVQGTHPTPFEVRVGVRTLSDDAWKRLEDTLSEKALFMAQLLSGEMPREIESTFQTCKLSLFPTTPRELDADCTCPDWGDNPCPHVAAVYYVLADQFDEDPFLLFTWRGRTREDLVDALRARRQDEVTAEVALPPPPPPKAAPEPLARSVGRFWRAGVPLTNLKIQPRAVAVPQAILRQLGTSGVDVRGADVHDLLAPAYVVMSRASEALAYEEREAQKQDQHP